MQKILIALISSILILLFDSAIVYYLIPIVLERPVEFSRVVAGVFIAKAVLGVRSSS